MVSIICQVPNELDTFSRFINKANKTSPHRVPVYIVPIKDLALPILPSVSHSFNKHSSLLGHSNQHDIMVIFSILKLIN